MARRAWNALWLCAAFALTTFIAAWYYVVRREEEPIVTLAIAAYLVTGGDKPSAGPAQKGER